MNRDIGVTELLRTVLPEWTVPIFELVAVLGNELVVVGILLSLAVRDLSRSIRRGSEQPVSDETAFVLAIVLGGLAFTLVLKTAFGLSRPPSSIQATSHEGNGFPSGHTMAATILWVTLAIWSERFTARRRFAAASLVVGIVGLSRLALGAHYLADVLASIAFGVGYVLLAAALTEQKPAKAFGGAALIGSLAVLVSSGSTDGWLAFIGCVGGALGWWISTQPLLRELWTSIASSTS